MQLNTSLKRIFFGKSLASRNRWGSSQELESLHRRTTAVTKSFLSGEPPLSVFNNMLDHLLEITGSEFGFIGDVFHDEDGAPYLKSRAISNIAWDQSSKDVYRPEGMEFRNLDSLFGHVLTEKKIVLTNDPRGDWRSAGTPHGHPPLESFLGVPLMHNDQLIGMIGLANRPEGFEESMVNFIDPLISACANVLWGMRLTHKLVESRRRYQDLFDDAPMMYVITRIGSDESVIIQECNALFCQSLGYDRSEIIGRPFAEFLTAESRQVFLDTGFATATTVGLCGASTGLVAKDGSILHTELVAIPDTGDDGVVTGSRAMFVDVTKDVEARRKQERISADLSQLIDFANAPILTIDKEGFVTEWNQQAAKITGLSRAAMVGRDLLAVGPAFAPKEKIAALHAVLINALDGTETSEYEFSLINRKGETVDLLLNMAARRDFKGAISGVIIIGLDVSERTKAERARIEKDRLYRQFIEELPLSIWEEDWSKVKKELDQLKLHCESDLVNYFSTHPELLFEMNKMTKVLQVNPYTYTLFELTEEDGSPADPEDIDNVFAANCGRGLAMLYFENKDLRENYAVKSYKGNVLQIQSYTLIPEDAREDWSRVISIAQDRTELEIKEQALRQAQKMEAVGQLTGGIAHDFNNLLSVISGNIRFLKQDIEGISEEIDVLLDDAASAAKDGAELTQRLLSFSRTSSLHPETTNVCDIIRKFVRFLNRTLGENTELKINLPIDDLLISVDVSQLENSLLNLALNARDAMPNGGSITISANRQLVSDVSHLSIVGLPNEIVRISVTDSGEGIDEENIERVFDPFFTTKEPGKGSGLGLSMVYGFTKQSDGYCAIDHSSKEGTTVSMYFPGEPIGDTCKIEVDDATPLSVLGSGVVLVVEDEPRVRRVALRNFRQLGFETLEAENADAAIAIIESGKDVDLVFSDVVMPGEMNGYCLADWLVRNHKDVRIILTSGYTKAESVSMSSDGDEFPVLQKPYSNEDLAERVSSTLGN